MCADYKSSTKGPHNCVDKRNTPQSFAEKDYQCIFDFKSLIES